MRRDEIIAALEGCSHLCLDTESERILVAGRLQEAMHACEAAKNIRAALAGFSSTEGRVSALLSHRKNLALLVDNAARLAGCDEEPNV